MTNKIIWAGGVNHTLHHPGLNPNQPLRIHHPATSVIAVNGKQQKPSTTYSLPQGENNVTCHCLFHPIDKFMQGYWNEKTGKFSSYMEEPSIEDLDYFKKKGNNVLIFLHGFNVGKGYYGGLELDKQETVDVGGNIHLNLYGKGPRCTYARTYEDLNFPDDIPYICGSYCKSNHDRNVAIDMAVNGAGSCNWLLDMEYNLNCAAAGQYPFPWEQHALDYTRILAFHWNGNVAFWEAQNNAVGCGLSLAAEIERFHKHGLKINIIAHSLGNLVLLSALQNLAINGNYEYVDRVIMWEAAVSDKALSPTALPVHDQIPHGYFPMAFMGAKQFTVLYSHEDDVLKDIYSLQDFFGNIPHPENIHPAMGFRGPDEETLSKLPKKITAHNQKNWLGGHSDMKIPTKALFDHVYLRYVINKDNGIANFGNWPIK